jgi:hypothetical protein
MLGSYAQTGNLGGAGITSEAYASNRLNSLGATILDPTNGLDAANTAFGNLDQLGLAQNQSQSQLRALADAQSGNLNYKQN